jgi:hypothetical protein
VAGREQGPGAASRRLTLALCQGAGRLFLAFADVPHDPPDPPQGHRGAPARAAVRPGEAPRKRGPPVIVLGLRSVQPRPLLRANQLARIGVGLPGFWLPPTTSTRGPARPGIRVAMGPIRPSGMLGDGAQDVADPNMLTMILVGAILMLPVLMPLARQLGARRQALERREHV